MQTAPYITARDAAEAWGISQRRVATLCSEGRIAEATMLGKMWLIPIQARKPEDARNSRKKAQPAKPFLKWAGGKGQLIANITERFPRGIGSNITKYAEPFIGGGAMLFEILQKYNIQEAYISDVNQALIIAYQQIKENAQNLIIRLQKLQNEFLPLSQEDRKLYYYNKREVFNSLNIEDKCYDLECAALMIFINKTCFNGLYRVNSKGKYNVPMGDCKNPLICDESNLKAVSRLLKGVKIINGSYTKSQEFIDEKTLVYFDPPYRPLPNTASFTAYAENGFNDNEQIKLAKYAKWISEKGAKVMLSNSDPKNTNIEDNFFDELYKDFNVQRIQAHRMINSSGEKRGKIAELLITNY